jgi:hypothetical protein
LLQLAELVASGTTLLGLAAFAEDDLQSWEAFAARVLDPNASWDWRKCDCRREAAVGLAARCDAATLWESLRLGDPLVAPRDAFADAVVTGIVTSFPTRTSIKLLLDGLTCRLRESTTVEAFPGYPRDLPPAGTSGAVVRGRVASTCITTGEQLIFRVEDAIIRIGAVGLGQRLTFRPRSVDRQQRSGCHELHRRYAARRSWLSGGPPRVPRRRDVPIEVVVAAAE